MSFCVHATASGTFVTMLRTLSTLLEKGADILRHEGMALVDPDDLFGVSRCIRQPK